MKRTARALRIGWVLAVLSLPNLLFVLWSPQMADFSVAKRAGFVLAGGLFVWILDLMLPRTLVRWLLLPGAFLLPLELQVLWEMGEITSGGLLNAAAAGSVRDITEFLRARWWLVLLPLVSGTAWLRWSKDVPGVTGVRRRLACLCICLCGVAWDVRQKTELAGNLKDGAGAEMMLVMRLWPTGIPLRINDYVRTRLYSQALMARRGAFHYQAHADSGVPKGLISVMVIGESSRRANWQAYGYSRATTPRLLSTPGIVWLSDVLAAGNTTFRSVPQLVTRAIPDSFDRVFTERSWLAAAKESGAGTAWISTQWVGSGGSSPEFMAIARDADTVVPADQGRLGGDSLALAPLAEFCRRPGRLVLVVHLSGSHSDYVQRSSLARKVFLPEAGIMTSDRKALVNAYDNTILESDWVLERILALLERTGRPAVLCFVSDHGENLMDDTDARRGHGAVRPTAWELEVPAFFWASSRARALLAKPIAGIEANRGRAVSFRNLSETFLDLSGIRSHWLAPQYSMAHSPFQADPRRVVLPDGSLWTPVTGTR